MLQSGNTDGRLWNNCKDFSFSTETLAETNQYYSEFSSLHHPTYHHGYICVSWVKLHQPSWIDWAAGFRPASSLLNTSDIHTCEIGVHARREAQVSCTLVGTGQNVKQMPCPRSGAGHLHTNGSCWRRCWACMSSPRETVLIFPQNIVWCLFIWTFITFIYIK